MAARICVTSDLHVGITPETTIAALARAIAAKEPNLTILAGDLGEGLTAYRRCLSLFSDLTGRLGAVAGNHDLWRREGHTSDHLWTRGLPAATPEAGALWLEDSTWNQ